MDKVNTDSMFQLWRILMVVLVVSVFAGIAMQLGTVISFKTGTAVSHPRSSTVNPFTEIFHGGGSKGIAGLRARAIDSQGRLKLDKELISRLKGQYGKGLSNPMVQVQATQEVRKHLQSQYPANADEKMGEALRAIFPENSEQLLKMSARYAGYDAWLKENWGILLGKSRQERESIIWDKRREVFGSDAQKIWPDDQREKTISQVLTGLNKVKGSSLSEKLSFFADTIHQEYAPDADAYIRDHQKELLERFIRLESVQADLRMMQPQVRRQNLMAVGQVLGMDTNSLARWEALEKARDERWGKGIQYMKDRQQVMEKVPAELREVLLNELRQKYFDKESARIAAEEKSGYFRYRAKRVYGLN